MNRRGFLLGSVAGAGLLPALGRAQPLGQRNRVTCVIFSDITPQTSADHLLAACRPLVAVGLPVTLLVDPFGGERDALGSDTALSGVLRSLLEGGQAVSIAAYVRDLGTRSAYFQGRAVRDANAALREVLAFSPNSTAARSSLPVVGCADVESPKAPLGVKSAGVSSILTVPETDLPISSEAWPNGVARFYGGRWIDLGRYSGAGLHAEEDATQAFFYISAKDLEAHPFEVIATRASMLAEDLLASESSGRNTVQPASDLLLRDDYGFERFVALHLTRPAVGDVAAEQGFALFQQALEAQGISASTGDALGVFEAGRATDYWLPVTEASDSVEFQEVTRGCQTAIVALRDAPRQAMPPGHAMALGSLTSTPGFDGCGVLWLPTVEISAPDDATNVTAQLGPTQDTVISVRPEALVPGYARTSLLNQLLSLASDGVTQIVPVQQLGRRLAPEGAEIERQRRTLAALPSTRPRRARSQDGARDALMEDARIAWTYIEQNTLRDTGLCPATVNFSVQDGRIHPTVTMWDVGSHINGVMAAFQLGLIEAKEFDRRIDMILRQIGGRTTDGRHLPQGWLRVDRHSWGNRNFDGSDTGRLLSALQNLSRLGGYKDRLHDLVGRWDLEKVVIGGEIHSITDGNLHSMYRSHSGPYAARAFGAWDVEVASAYDVFGGRSRYDGQMALLEAVSWIGPLGAEPLLLEALEMGMSAEAAYLAEVLFAAQIEEHAETGRLIAVSEGPIDVRPWFTYQGLQTDADERTWALDTVGFEPQYNDPVFRRDHLVISTKAAFLWAAYKPHAYSDKLLAHARENCRTKRGFASSTFVETGRVTDTYSDLNTNAIILQSIAKMLTEV